MLLFDFVLEYFFKLLYPRLDHEPAITQAGILVIKILFIRPR